MAARMDFQVIVIQSVCLFVLLYLYIYMYMTLDAAFNHI